MNQQQLQTGSQQQADPHTDETPHLTSASEGVDDAAPGTDEPIIETSPAEEGEPSDAGGDVSVDDSEEPEDESSSPKEITVPTRAMAKIKAKAREKGRREAEEQFEEKVAQIQSDFDKKLESVAKMFGFENWSEVETADPEEFWKSKQESQSRPEESGTRSQEQEKKTVSDEQKNQADEKMRRDYQRLLDEKKRLNKARAHEERRRRELERQMEAKEAETELRMAAARAGVTDVDYALHLLKKDLSGKSEEEMKDFDTAKFFSEDLRQKYPYLYGAEVEPATTGVGSEESSTTAVAGGSQKAAAESNGTLSGSDARKLSQDEYRELLRKRGLNDPSVGMPSG